MASILRTLAILFVGYVLAASTNAALGTMDARKLLVLWAIYVLAIHGLLPVLRKRSTKPDRG